MNCWVTKTHRSINLPAHHKALHPLCSVNLPATISQTSREIRELIDQDTAYACLPSRIARVNTPSLQHSSIKMGLHRVAAGARRHGHFRGRSQTVNELLGNEDTSLHKFASTPQSAVPALLRTFAKLTRFGFLQAARVELALHLLYNKKGCHPFLLDGVICQGLSIIGLPTPGPSVLT